MLWLFPCKFPVDADFLGHKAIDLVAGGLDTVARVYLNDILVLESNNMFRRYVREVSKILKVRFVSF